MVVIRIGQRMILHAGGVNPSPAISVGAYPDTSVGILLNSHDGGGEAFKEMTLQTVVGIKEVDTVLVCAHPRAMLSVDQYAHHTCGANGVTLMAETVAHITEAIEGYRLAVQTFLQQSEPEVTVTVLGNGVHLALGQVHLHAEEGVIAEGISLGIVDGNTLTVVAHDDTVVAVAEECRYTLVARGGDMYEALTLLTVQSGIGAHIDMSLTVGAELPEDEVLTVVEIVAELLPVVAEQTVLVCDHPQVTVLILQQRVHGMQSCEDTSQLARRLFVGELHHTES